MWDSIASGTVWETSGEIHRELHYSTLRAGAQLRVILSILPILSLKISNNFDCQILSSSATTKHGD